MVNENLEKITEFSDFDEAASYILQLLSRQAGMSSLYIAKQQGGANLIVKVHNTKHHLIEEGEGAPLPCTLSSLSIEHGAEALVIERLSAHELTRSLGISDGFEEGCFIGVPIFYEDGSVYGTLCGVDDGPCDLPEDLPFAFETLATLMTYVLKLGQVDEESTSLMMPIVPIIDNIALLPVIGEINVSPKQAMIDHILHGCAEKGVEVLVIDVSGVQQIGPHVSDYLLKLVDALGLAGVKPVIIGIEPSKALTVPHFTQALTELLEANLETALKQAGFGFHKN